MSPARRVKRAHFSESTLVSDDATGRDEREATAVLLLNLHDCPLHQPSQHAVSEADKIHVAAVRVRLRAGRKLQLRHSKRGEEMRQLQIECSSISTCRVFARAEEQTAGEI